MPTPREIVYEPHPVSEERKKELKDKGFKIIDERFRPAAAVIDNPDLAEQKTRIELASVLNDLPSEQDNADEVVARLRETYGALFTLEDEEIVRQKVKGSSKNRSKGLSIDDIKVQLKDKNIDFPADAKRPELARLLDEAQE